MEYNNDNLDPMFIYYWIKMGCKPIVVVKDDDQEEENEEQN